MLMQLRSILQVGKYFDLKVIIVLNAYYAKN